MSGYILLVPPSLWNSPPTPDTIPRKRVVHPLLKRWERLRPRNPDSRSRVAAAVTGWVTQVSLSLTLSPVYLLRSVNALNTHIGVAPAEAVGLISLAPPLPQLCIRLARLCRTPPPVFVRASPLRLLHLSLTFRHLLP